jgi:hypothetical protein
MERNEDARMAYMYHMNLLYEPEQLVFVDESSCDRRISRGYGRAPAGRRVARNTVFIRGKRCPGSVFLNVAHNVSRYSVLPAISLEGILTVKIIEGSFDSDSFARFIDSLLDHMNPFPGPNSVVVMDNCRIHKSDHVRDMIEMR